MDDELPTHPDTGGTLPEKPEATVPELPIPAERESMEGPHFFDFEVSGRDIVAEFSHSFHPDETTLFESLRFRIEVNRREIKFINLTPDQPVYVQGADQSSWNTLWHIGRKTEKIAVEPSDDEVHYKTLGTTDASQAVLGNNLNERVILDKENVRTSVALWQLFSLAKNTPLDLYLVDTSELQKASLSREMLVQMARVEMNRTLRNQTAFMKQAGVALERIEQYEKTLQSTPIRLTSRKSGGQYRGDGKTYVDASQPQEAVWPLMQAYIPHEMVHINEKGYRFIEDIERAIKKRAPLVRRVNSAAGAGVIEGFTEFATRLMNQEPVLDDDYEFDTYARPSEITRKIYRDIINRHGQQLADQIISFFAMGDRDSFISLLGLGTSITEGEEKIYDYLYDKFQDIKQEDLI